MIINLLFRTCSSQRSKTADLTLQSQLFVLDWFLRWFETY